MLALETSQWSNLTRCSDVQTDESRVSDIFIRFSLSDHQNDSLMHLIPDYKDKVSSLSTEALLLHESLKVQQVNPVDMVNNGRKRSEYLRSPLYGAVLIPHVPQESLPHPAHLHPLLKYVLLFRTMKTSSYRSKT